MCGQQVWKGLVVHLGLSCHGKRIVHGHKVGYLEIMSVCFFLIAILTFVMLAKFSKADEFVALSVVNSCSN
jgi:hypothetical protein